MSLDGAELMERHIEALYTHDERGDLLRVRESNGAPAPRVFVGRTERAIVHRFRRDLPASLRARLIDATDPARALVDDRESTRAELSRLSAILEEDGAVQASSAGPAFVITNENPAGAPHVIRMTTANASLLEPLLVAWLPDVDDSPPLFAAIVEDRAVAVCGSVRITARAHEAGVETAGTHRREGHAAAVVSAWGRAVRALGATPLYSTSWENVASRAVARTLGLEHFGNDLHLT